MMGLKIVNRKEREMRGEMSWATNIEMSLNVQKCGFRCIETIFANSALSAVRKKMNKWRIT